VGGWRGGGEDESRTTPALLLERHPATQKQSLDTSLFTVSLERGIRGVFKIPFWCNFDSKPQIAQLLGMRR